MSAKQKKPTAAEWIDEKAVNFLRHIQDLCNRYPVPEHAKATILTGTNKWLESSTTRQVLCSPGARSQIANNPMFMQAIVGAIQFFNKSEEAREESLDESLDRVENVLQQALTFIQTFKQEEESQKQLLTDLTKVCGYLELFFGPFLSSSDKSASPSISSGNGSSSQ